MAGLRDIEPHEQASPSPLDTALAEALRAKMRAILDRDEFNAAMLGELEKTARLARELLIVGRDPKALPRVGGLSTLLNGGDYMSDSGSAMAASSPAETFGATLIREFVPAITALVAPKPEREPSPPTLFDMVTAAAYAKEKGLEEMAATLDQQLAERFQPKQLPGVAEVYPPEPTREKLNATE